MRWGSKSERGCSGTTCGKAHPTLCPRSQDLKCLDRLCPWKLHTHRCVRSDPGRGHAWGNGRNSSQGNRDQFRGNFQGNRVQRPNSLYPRQGYGGDPFVGQGGGPAGRHVGRHAGGLIDGHAGGRAGQGVGHAGTLLRGHNRAWADPGNNQCFQDLTAQQNLLGALEQQLQLVLSRVIKQALTTEPVAMQAWGTGGGIANPSS